MGYQLIRLSQLPEDCFLRLVLIDRRLHSQTHNSNINSHSLLSGIASQTGFESFGEEKIVLSFGIHLSHGSNICRNLTSQWTLLRELREKIANGKDSRE